MSKALIAMSGGVDSSVAAFLIKQQGYDCIGATMKLFDNEDIGVDKKKSCCSLEDMQDARSVANRLDIPFYVFNFTADFKRNVMQKFVEAYQNGETPNPCVDCNGYMKFEKLLHRAKQLGFDYLVTGHYARIEHSTESGRYLLKKGLDETKDQSYVLYAMTQEQLTSTIFPLGGLRKEEVRSLAGEIGLVTAQKEDSQDICFVANGDYADFIEQYLGEVSPRGDFLDRQGNILGTHNGIIRYTIGQRKGFGLSFPQPVYVLSKDANRNTVTLGNHAELFTTELYAKDFNWIAFEKPEKPFYARAKIRYNQKEQPAFITPLSDGTVYIRFEQPVRAVAKGQAVVLYDGDVVIGGGRIL